jgi:hypothetical protein
MVGFMIFQIIPSTSHSWCVFMCWVALESPCAFLCDYNWIYKSTTNSKYLIFFLQNNHVVYWHHQQWASNNILLGVLSVIITTCQLKGFFYVSLKLASFWLSFRNIFLLSFFHFLYICENVLFISSWKWMTCMIVVHVYHLLFLFLVA